MQKLIDITAPPVSDVLDILLQDKSCKIGERKYKNIIWATDTYSEYGGAFSDTAEMTAASLSQYPDIIKPRIEKSSEEQNERTRKKAEVFTPARLCNKMNNYIDADWFGREDVFNAEKEDGGWKRTEGRIEFPKKKRWQRYIDSRRLEIACGEAPFLVSRYDVSTGEIIPVKDRIGILDRKLRIVSENARNNAEWEKYALRALESCYGYDYQGDNVLIARINLLLTFIDYCSERFGKQPDLKLLKKAANKIAWNIWQMDGLTGLTPLGKPYEEFKQLNLIFEEDLTPNAKPEREAKPCRIYNWRSKLNLTMKDIKENAKMAKKLFDYVIGNPPYQEETNKNNRQEPIYDKFMSASYEVADKVELITPARFLFDAGQTPKSWNKKMLNDPHFKVLMYEPNGSLIFPNTDIKGGVAITYRDRDKYFGAINTFVEEPILQEIVTKVVDKTQRFLSENGYPKSSYNFTNNLYIDNPELKSKLSKGNEYIIDANIFKKMPQIFLDTENSNTIKVYGREDNKRVHKWIDQKYIKDFIGISKYKVFVTGANGKGEFGEILSNPFIGEPRSIGTQTYMSFGWFATRDEAEACLKYIKSKFARSLLGVMKKTQNNPKETWSKIPLQDFTDKSDIDWSKSIPETDAQLYKKYGLDDKEIEFIESKVKAME